MDGAIVPPSRPQRPRAWAQGLLDANGCFGERVALLAVRGYYRDSMGVPGQNDRGIYDDAICLVTPEVYATFNANTDPSVTRPGVAVLSLGTWRYKKGKHKINDPNGYPAFVQADKVTVIRDQQGPDTGYFGINIHKGGRTTTSSLGCQTLWPDQWQAFRTLVYAEMDRASVTTIPYCLVEVAG